jgi:hypothetical protein
MQFGKALGSCNCAASARTVHTHVSLEPQSPVSRLSLVALVRTSTVTAKGVTSAAERGSSARRQAPRALCC